MVDFSFSNILFDQIQILDESKRVSDLNQIGAFQDLSQSDMLEIIELDPTYKENGYVGKYGIYLLDNYVKGKLANLKPNEIRGALNWFHLNKENLKSKRIRDYDVDELCKLSSEQSKQEMSTGIQPWPSVEEMLKRTPSSQYLEIPSPNPEYRVFYPLTWEASRKLGGSTKWCTASSTRSYFEDYFTKGGVFIFVNKVDGTAKYQYHSSEYYDEELKDETNEDVSELYDELGIRDLDERVYNYWDIYLETVLTNQRNSIQSRLDSGDYVWVSESPKDIDSFTGETIYVFGLGDVASVQYHGKIGAAVVDNGKITLTSYIEYKDVIAFGYGYAVLTHESNESDIEYGRVFTSMPEDEDLDNNEKCFNGFINQIRKGILSVEDIKNGKADVKYIGKVGEYIAFSLYCTPVCAIMNKNTLELSEVKGDYYDSYTLFANVDVSYEGNIERTTQLLNSLYPNDDDKNSRRKCFRIFMPQNDEIVFFDGKNVLSKKKYRQPIW